MTHNNKTTEELSKENEIMGKILIDIILHNDNVSDERITTLFNQTDWKERVDFSVKDDGKIGWKGKHSWISKPEKIFRRFKKEKEELKKKTEEQVLKINELKKELEEKELLIEKQKEQIATAELDAKTHYDFIGALQELNGKVRDELHEEIENKTDLLETANEIINDHEAEIKSLRKEAEEKSELLDKSHEIIGDQEKEIQELQSQIHLFNKPLPPLPNKKKQNSIGTKIKSKLHKFQNLAKKVKQEGRELIARIEVRTN